jgi:HlyD family secretion protein
MSFFNRLKSLLKKKSVIALLVLAAIIGGYAWFQKGKGTEPPKYVLAAVSKGSVIESISGSGQVSGLRQFDVKPAVSAKITKIFVKPGDAVTTETPIAQLDATDAQKAIRDAQQSLRDAQISYESQKLSYQKETAPADASEVLQAENAVKQAKRDLDDLLKGPDASDVASAENDVKTQKENTKISYDGALSVGVRNAYDNAVTAIKNAAKSAKQGAHDAQPIIIANDPNISNLSPSKLMEAIALSYDIDENVAKLDKAASSLTTTGAKPGDIDAALVVAKDALGKAVPYLQKLSDALLNTTPSSAYSATAISSLKTTIDGDLSDAMSKLSTVLTQVQTIDSAKTSYATALINLQKAEAALAKLNEPADANKVATANEKIAQAEESLKELKSGLSAVDLAIAQNSLKQRQSALASAQNKLADAQKTLADYTIKAPFAGTIAAISADVADEASPSTAIATVVTTAKIAELSLNEVDAAKIAVGQKATLTFDAVSDLSVAGVVSEVDSIGTASQGVVNYSIKIVFETQDDRVKSGMSVTAQIITSAKTDVLTLPNAAVHTANSATTVSILPNANTSDQTAFTQGVSSSEAPQSKQIEIGEANDQVTEIVSGLNEGDIVVLRTVSGSSSASKTTSSSSSSRNSTTIRMPGLGGSGGPP